MKKIFLLFASLTLVLNFSFAQQVEDSVNMNSDYAMDVFYSLDNGTVQTVASAEWTVALSTGAQTSSAYINEGKGVELYETSLAISDFNNNIDTSGISSWTKLHNEHNDWEQSAFESGATGHPNYGWGDYNNVSHIVTGTKVFVLKTLSGEYLKAAIVKKEAGAWYYRYATLNSSFDTTIVYQATDLQDKNFAYLNMENHLVADREPANTDWDMLFTRYHDTDLDYAVTGVLVNKGVEVVRVDGVSPADASYVGETFDANTKTIGSDWKEFDMTIPPFGAFVLDDDRTYFVKQLDGDIYKMNFTRFDGQSTGKIGFTKEKMAVSSVNDIEAINSVSVYPNPAQENAFISLDLFNDAQVSYTITNMIGKIVATNNVDLNSGLNIININTSKLNTGIYLVQLQSGNEAQTFKLSINK